MITIYETWRILLIYFMEMAKDKRFVKSSVRAIDWQYWTFFNVDINKDDFNALPVNDSWYVKLTMSEFKDWPNQYWNTHYLVLNDRVPNKNKSDWWVPVEEAHPTDALPSTDDDLPF